ncbi:hypothetical protein [Umezawaea tangerina]|nr:hypothetical protein [Umezawaea tangerina]
MPGRCRQLLRTSAGPGRHDWTSLVAKRGAGGNGESASGGHLMRSDEAVVLARLLDVHLAHHGLGVTRSGRRLR